MAPIGSTTLLSEPNTNDLHRLLPAARLGMEMMEPSGMFRMAMPKDTEMARLTICVERRFPLPQTPRQRPCLRAGCVWLLLMLNFLRLPPALYYCFMFTLAKRII